MMVTGKIGKWVLAGVLAVAAPLAQAAAGDLEKVLQQMDAASQKFQNAQADFEWDQFQVVVQDKDVQKGTIAFLRKGQQTLMVAHIRDLNGKPAPKDLLYRDGELKFYQPMIKQLTIFAAGANRSQYESFFTLGFGGSGSDLQKSWDVSYLGTEAINGIQTAKLDLKPKQDSVRKNVSHVTIWVDPARAISLKQQFFEPSGDYRTTFFSNIRYNSKLSEGEFNLKTASGTQVIRK